MNRLLRSDLKTGFDMLFNLRMCDFILPIILWPGVDIKWQSLCIGNYHLVRSNDWDNRGPKRLCLLRRHTNTIEMDVP